MHYLLQIKRVIYIISSTREPLKYLNFFSIIE